jgi:hypothetical protein
MKLVRQFFLAGALSLLSAGLLSGLAYATTIEFSTQPGAKEPANSLPVDATASFVTSNGQLTITLYNLQANPSAVGQNLSDLIFTISTGQTTGTLTSSSGVEITVASNGSYTMGSSVSTGGYYRKLWIGDGMKKAAYPSA